MAQEQWTCGGLTFDVQVDGPAQGDPVLLLHGFPQNSTEWRAVAARLQAAGYQTIAPDQRGYSPGARPEDVREYRMDRLVSDAVALLEHRGLASAHVVGHDWGAAVAWSLTAAHPERVRTLTAISVPHPAAFAAALRSERDQRRKSAYMLFLRRPKTPERVLLAFDARAMRRLLRRSGMSKAEIQGYVEPLQQPGALTAALNWYRASSGRVAAATPPVTRPTTFLWSDRDPAIGRGSAEACGQYVESNYRFVELNGLNHWLPDQAPDRVAEAILARMRAC